MSTDWEPIPEPDSLPPDDLDPTAEAHDDGDEMSMVLDQLEDLTSRIEAVEEHLADLAAGGPWCWRYLARDQTRALAEELRDWVDWLIARYRLTNIPACWFRHGDYVEELTALYVAWKAAYNPRVHQPNDGPINWHDRWFRPCMSRLQAGGCFGGKHQSTTALEIRTDLDDFDAWLSEQDDTIGPTASSKAVTAAVRAGDAVPLLSDPTGPVLIDGQWWTRRRETPRRLAPDWSRRDPFTTRRLDHLAAHQPLDPITGEIAAGADEQQWTREAVLAAQGMALVKMPQHEAES